jgi:glucosamine-phosphate N-acetyltransferase
MSLHTSVTDDSMPLFSASLISPEVVAQLPEGYTLRPLQKGDYQKGFLDVLRVLTTVGDVTEEVRELHLLLLRPLSHGVHTLNTKTRR